MSYAIIRNANYKMKNLSGIYRHNERKNTTYSNIDIDKNKLIENYSLKRPSTTYEKLFKSIREKYNLKGQIKSVSNVACEYIITSDKDFFDQIGLNETKRFFQVAYSFACNYKNLGEQYILSAKVHMDESTPHMHLVFIPIVNSKDKNGNNVDKIACSEFWKGKNSYKNLQDSFYHYMIANGFQLERGKESNREHLSTDELKTLTHYEKIKKEIVTTPMQKIETTSLEVALNENVKLVHQNNKLNEYCIHTSHVIDKCTKYENEISSLKYQNTQLKKKLFQLNKTINNILKTICHNFKISKSNILKLIEDFIK